VSAPSNYDDAGLLIRVNADRIFQSAATDIPNQAQVIANAINNIVQIWNGLKLGWVGTTASEAQQFNDQWTNAVKQLFGTDSDPSSGALPRIADGVALAAINYGEAEDAVTKMFNSLTVGLDLSGINAGMQSHMPPGTQPLPVGPSPGRTPTPQSGDPVYNPVSESAPPPS